VVFYLEGDIKEDKAKAAQLSFEKYSVGFQNTTNGNHTLQSSFERSS
jgi:hypothetical protein